MLNTVQQMRRQMDQMALIIQSLTGKDMGVMEPQEQTGGAPQTQAPVPDGKMSESGFASGVMEAQTPMTAYGQRLAKRSRPSLE